MRSVVLYGELAKRFGKHHKFAVKNAAEALRALRANFKDFESYMFNAHHSNVGFHVRVGRTGLNEAKEVHLPSGEDDVIRIIPAIIGSGSPVFRIILGAVLIVAGVIAEPYSAGASTALISFGIALAFGGVVQLLTKAPDKREVGGYQEPEHKDSYIFDGPVNTSVQGASVPVVYGRMIVGSKVISAGIEAYEEP